MGGVCTSGSCGAGYYQNGTTGCAPCHRDCSERDPRALRRHMRSGRAKHHGSGDADACPDPREHPAPEVAPVPGCQVREGPGGRTDQHDLSRDRGGVYVALQKVDQR